MKQQLHLYWFSGSGNTLQAASVFAERLRQREWSVELRPLEQSDPLAIDPEAVLGLAFPTYFFAIPEMVRTFVRSLPRTEGTSAMMLGTHGVLSGGVVGPMKRELTAKGFRCVAARILVMPDSFFPLLGSRTHRWQLTRGLKSAKRYADDFADERVRWTRWAILSDLHGALFGGMFAARKWTRNCYSTVFARNKLCTRCGICIQCCPVNALESYATSHSASHSEKATDSPPRPKRNCTNCLRCVAVCPHDAMRHIIGFPYRSEDATSLERHFKEAIAQTQIQDQPQNLPQG